VTRKIEKALCAVCGQPPKFPFFGVYPLSKKGECKSCVNRMTMLRRWRVERELMDEYRLRALKTHVGVPLTPEISAKVSAGLRGRKRCPMPPHVMVAMALGLLRRVTQGEPVAPRVTAAAALGLLRRAATGFEKRSGLLEWDELPGAIYPETRS